MLKLTSAVARSLSLPPGQRDKTYFNSEVAAFGVRVRAGGSRNWVIQYKVGGKRHQRADAHDTGTPRLEHDGPFLLGGSVGRVFKFAGQAFNAQVDDAVSASLRLL